MKVTVIYDFSVDIECFKRDKAVIKCSYEEYRELTETLLHCASELLGTEQGRQAFEVYKKLRDYDTKSIG